MDTAFYRAIRGLPITIESVAVVLRRLGGGAKTETLCGALASEWPQLAPLDIQRLLYVCTATAGCIVVGEPAVRVAGQDPTYYRLDVGAALWHRNFRRVVNELPSDLPASSPRTVAGCEVSEIRRSRIKTAADRRKRAGLEWTVADTLPEYGVAQLVGPSYGGKTYVAIGMALSICNGSVTEWFGREIRRHGDAVFVLMEGAWDFQARLDAWLLEHPDTTDERLFTVEEPDDFDLTEPTSVVALADEIEGAGISPALLVIDTQSLAAASAEENSNSDMTKVFLALKYLAKRLNCIVMPLHHSGLGGEVRARGASAQFASADVQLVLTRGTLQAVKVKAYRPWDKPEGFEICGNGESAYARPRALLPAVADGSVAARADLKRRVLEVIVERAGLTMTQLSDRIGGNNRLRGDAVNDLIVDGLVREERGQHNARCLHPTEKALAPGSVA